MTSWGGEMGWAQACVAGVFLALLPSGVAAAQEGLAPCPGANDGAGPAEHAVCWFNLEQSADPACAGAGCSANAVGWCADAPLDDPRVADSCFLALVQTGRFDTARELAEYLSAPSAQARACRDAIVGIVPARVVTNPAGGVISVDGRSYGAGPVEVQLTSPWWERQVVAEFGGTRLEVTREQLVTAFDGRSCVMGDVVIEGPSDVVEAAVAPTPPPPPTETNAPDDGEDDEQDDGEGGGALRPVGWALVGLGGALGVAALVTGLLAESTYRDLESACSGGVCPPDRMDDASSGSTLATASTVTLFAGIASAAAGAVLLLVSADGDRDEPDAVAVRVGPGPGLVGASAEVSF